MGDGILEEKKTNRASSLIILILVLFCSALIVMNLWENITTYLG